MLEVAGDVYEIRRLGCSGILARFPVSDEGTRAAYEDLARRLQRERRSLLPIRILGVLAAVSGLVWIGVTIVQQVTFYWHPDVVNGFVRVFFFDSDVQQRIIHDIAYRLLVISTALALIWFMARRAAREDRHAHG
ncbi:MAG: hypothetical protein QOI81_1609 [Actinomycetota bacterium]|nr:hypothetical protein [Actinomycetota bacterium]